MREKVSVLLPAFNERETLRACLETVKWADEIVLVDSFSTDATLAIAHEYGARILQHEYLNSATQKNWAIPRCTHPWVLQIDADERLEEPLQQEIQAFLDNPPPAVAGCRMPFKHHILGEWVRAMGLYPEYHLRLFRRDVGRFQDREVDAHVSVPGEVHTFQHHFLHYGVESISQRLAPLDRYTRYEADQRYKQGRRFNWLAFLARPVGTFLYYYFWRGGFKHGFRGVFYSVHRAEFVFWTYAKLWEKKWRSQIDP